MTARIIEFSIKNRFLVLLLTFALIVASVWGTLHLSLDAIPDLSDAQVIIVTENEGQNPEVMDKQITYPLASAMLSVNAKAVSAARRSNERIIPCPLGIWPAPFYAPDFANRKFDAACLKATRTPGYFRRVGLLRKDGTARKDL